MIAHCFSTHIPALGCDQKYENNMYHCRFSLKKVNFLPIMVYAKFKVCTLRSLVQWYHVKIPEDMPAHIFLCGCVSCDRLILHPQSPTKLSEEFIFSYELEHAIWPDLLN
jgi:hypothetical protein